MSKKHKFKVGDKVIWGQDNRKFVVYEVPNSKVLSIETVPGEKEYGAYEEVLASQCVPIKAKKKASRPKPMPCHGCACQKALKPKETPKEAMPESLELPRWALGLANLLINQGWVDEFRTGMDKELAMVLLENVPVTALDVAHNSNYIKELESLVDNLNKKVDRKSEVINQLMLTIHSLS